MIRSFRNLLLIAFLASVTLPPAALIASTSSLVQVSEGYKVVVYTVLGLAALPAFADMAAGK